MKIFVTFTLVLLIMCASGEANGGQHEVSDEDKVSKEGENCRLHHKCEEGTYCTLLRKGDYAFDNEVVCQKPETRTGSPCQEMDIPDSFYINPPCAEGLKCLSILDSNDDQCFTDERQRDTVYAQRQADQLKRFPCRGRNLACGEEGYCVRVGNYLKCLPPSQEGQPCEEKLTAEEIRMRRGEGLYSEYVPCAVGLACRKNDESKQIVCASGEANGGQHEVSDEDKVHKEGEDCRSNNKCEEGTYCTLLRKGDYASDNEVVCQKSETKTGSPCQEMKPPDSFYNNPPCAEGLKCLPILDSNDDQCFTDEKQRDTVYAQRRADQSKIFNCRGRNFACGEEGYCVRVGNYLKCLIPSHEGQPCEEKLTAEEIRMRRGEGLYSEYVPCAVGLACRKNDESKQVCVKDS